MKNFNYPSHPLATLLGPDTEHNMCFTSLIDPLNCSLVIPNVRSQNLVSLEICNFFVTCWLLLALHKMLTFCRKFKNYINYFGKVFYRSIPFFNYHFLNCKLANFIQIGQNPIVLWTRTMKCDPIPL